MSNSVAAALAQDLIEGKTFFTTARDHRSRLKETFLKGKQPGETTYFQQLDEILTLRMGFMYVFTGWPGSGKSEFITQLTVLQANFKNRKTALYSPESYPEDEFIDTIIHCYLGKSTDKRFPNVCSEKEYDEAIEWVERYYYFCDWEETPDVDLLLKSFKFLKDTKGVEIFVIDPFNSLDTGDESNLALILKSNLTKVKRFCSQNRIMIWIVEHPKTPARVEEYDEMPNNRNMFGGSMWWNKVDVGVSVHRPNRNDKFDNTVKILTWKVKRQQLNGRPGEQTIHYDVRTNRYYEHVSCREHPMGIIDLYKEPERMF